MRVILALPALAVAAACTPVVQTTSGAAYVAASPDIDPEIAAAAAVEPTLRFPARIGVVRLGGTQRGRSRRGATAIPAGEAEALTRFAARHGSFGTFVPLAPVLASLVAPYPRADGRTPQRTMLDGLRIAAARQHLDAILIYEVTGAAGLFGQVPLGDSGLTGMAPPGPSAAQASVLMLDVRNDYPYGMVSAEVDLEGLRPLPGRGPRDDRLRAAAAERAVAAALPELSEMLRQLAKAL